MGTASSKNLGNLRLERGGRYANAACAAEIQYERDMRAAFYAMQRDAGGKALRDRTLYNAAEGVTRLDRRIARLVRRAKARRVPYQLVHLALVDATERYLKRVWGFPEQHGAPGRVA